MSSLHRWWARIHNAALGHRGDQRLREELEFHVGLQTDENIRAGLSPVEARRQAMLRVGPVETMREDYHAEEGLLFLESLLRDARFALRQLKRAPGFTAAVVATLTLAIGVNTAVFSMLDGFLLRKPPYAEADRLGALLTHVEGVNLRNHRSISEEDDGLDTTTWRALRQNISAATVAAYGAGFSLSNGVNLDAGAAGGHAAINAQYARVSENYFQVLGIKPLLGREFSAQEDAPNGPNATILSYGIWHSVFHGDRGVLGQAIQVKGEPYTVVGVLGPNATTPNPAQIWLPVRAGDLEGVCGGGDNCGVYLRLGPGRTWEELSAQLSHLPRADYVWQGYKAWYYAQPYQRYASTGMRPKIETLMLAVALILMIACGNLAGLTLVRISRRTREIATRMALGASQGTVLRQLWLESLLLALPGCCGGILLASMTLTGLAKLLPAGMIPAGGFSLDPRVLAFSLGLSLATTLLFGALPALASRRVDLRTSLAAQSSAVAGGAGRLRRALIGGEVALTVVLLAAAGLLMRTLAHLETLPPGFNPQNVMTAKASLNDARYRDAATFRNLLEESVAAMKRIPGVKDAAVGLSTPYERGLNNPVKVTDGPLGGTEEAGGASSVAYVTPGFFQTLEIPLLAGRTFSDGDTAASQPVALVNQSFAKQFFHTANATGGHFLFGDSSHSQPMTVVGVVADVVKEPGLSGSSPLTTEPVFYVPAAQVAEPISWHIWFQPSWIVRTQGPVAGLAAAMQKALASVDSTLPFSGFYGMQELMDRQLQLQHIEVLLMAVLSGLALLLSVIGIYALVSHAVVQRTREVGIRLALGAPVSQAIRLIAMSGLRATAWGIVAGLLCSFLVLRLLKSALYGVGIYDPLTLTAVPLLLLALTAVASLVPALRITRIDPVETLRAE